MKPKEADNPGGIGFWIEFPEKSGLERVEEYDGIFTNTPIHRVEMYAIIRAMEATIDAVKENSKKLNGCPVRIITDRFSLQDDLLTNPYQIRDWRSNGWKTHEGKPIKNKDLVDRLDKTRKKLSDLVHGRVEIEWRRRKQNRLADKLSKKGSEIGGTKKDFLSKKGEKIGRRKFDGPEIKYSGLKVNDVLFINIFRKDPVQDQWEIWGEICEGSHLGQKLKIYADDQLSAKLKRGNHFEIKIKSVFRFHLVIYRTVRRINTNRL